MYEVLDAADYVLEGGGGGGGGALRRCACAWGLFGR
jgi:hypothetical protein